jgi:TolB-like protein/Tfp pilus assembly protein PilF
VHNAEAGSSESRSFRIGDWLFEPRLNRVSRGDEAQRIEPKLIDVMACLASRPGEVWSRDELLETVWGGRFVVEAVLSRAISELRRLLGDEASDPQVIETIRGRGYRMIAEVTLVDTPTGVGTTPSGADAIAVLPFANLSGDPDQDFLADGITEMLISNLAQVASLRVISRTSVMRYRDSDKTLPAIAAELGAGMVVEGSVTPAGDQVRVTAQLIEADSDTHVWADSFQRPVRDILALQDEVARAIVKAVDAELSSGEALRLSRSQPVRTEAHEAYLRGLVHWHERTPESFQKAIRFFNRSIELDSDSPLAFSGLSATHIILGLYGLLAPHDAFPKAREYNDQALTRDGEMPEALSDRAAISLFYEWDFPSAEKGFRRALERAPSNTLGRLGFADLLAALGSHEESVDQIRQAHALDPLDAGLAVNVGDMLLFAGRLEEAVGQMGRALDLDPHFRRAHYRLAQAHALAGDEAAASSHLESTLQISPPGPATKVLEAWVHAALGHGDRAVEGLREVEADSRYVAASEVAQAYSLAGAQDDALRWLDRASDERTPWMIFAQVEPGFEPLLSAPGFARCTAQVGLSSLPVS